MKERFRSTTEVEAERRTGPRVTLDPTLVLGFVGERSLADATSHGAALFDALSSQLASTPASSFAICSLSDTVELIFAESCMQLAVPLRLVLPGTADEVLRTMPTEVAVRAQAVMGYAIHSIVIGEMSMEDNLLDCRREVVLRSTLLFVLDTKDEVNGATAHALNLAGEMTKGAILVSSTRVVRRNEDAMHRALHDPELAFLNHLPDVEHLPAEASPEERARLWFAKIDRCASRSAPNVRRLASVPILYTALAAMLSSASSRGGNHAWLAASAVVGLTAGTVPRLLQVKKKQAIWARTRIASEVCRSILAVWDAPFQHDAPGSELMEELQGMLRSLEFLRLTSIAGHPVSLNAFKSRYRRERILEQRDYFAAHAERARLAIVRSRFILRGVTVIAVLLALGWIAGSFTHGGLRALSRSPWFPFAIAVLFQISTIVSAIEIVNDTRRRQRHYTQLSGWLTLWERQLPELRTWTAVQGLVAQVERALLVELTEWYSLARNTDLARR